MANIYDIINTSVTAASTLGGVYIGYILESSRNIIAEKTSEAKQQLQFLIEVKADANYCFTKLKKSFVDCMQDDMHTYYRMQKYYVRRELKIPIDNNEYEHMLSFAEKNVISGSIHSENYAETIRSLSKIRPFVSDLNKIDELIGKLEKLNIHPHSEKFENCKTEQECDDIATAIDEKVYVAALFKDLINPILTPLDNILALELSKLKVKGEQLQLKKEKIVKRNTNLFWLIGILSVIIISSYIFFKISTSKPAITPVKQQPTTTQIVPTIK